MVTLREVGEEEGKVQSPILSWQKLGEKGNIFLQHCIIQLDLSTR